MMNKLEQIIEEKGQHLKPLIEAELGKRSFFEFFKLATPVLYPGVDWQYPWFYKYICDELQQELERTIRKEQKEHDLIISLPFRSGKSILINVMFPVWAWIVEPSISIISISASEYLATKFSHQSKILLESEWFKKRWKDVKLRADSKSKLDFINTKNGRRTAFGIGSTIIGSGADIIILDDPQSPDDISEASLRNTLQTYTDTIYSRLNNPGIGFRVLLQQRVAENDLTGELIEMNPGGYKNIVIPAKLTKDVNPPELAIYYDHQGLFWPERFTEKVLQDFENTLRPNAYSSQLLQRPSPEEGNIIKREQFKIEDITYLNDKHIRWELILDTAFTSNTRNDPTALMIAGKYQNTMIILKVWQKWMEFSDLIRYIREIVKNYNINIIRIEKVSSGILIFQELRRQLTIPILELQPGSKDKLTRVQSILPQLETGRCILIKDKWNMDFINECIQFPFGKHDDQVDCLFYTMNLIRMGGTTKFF